MDASIASILLTSIFFVLSSTLSSAKREKKNKTTKISDLNTEEPTKKS